MIVIRNDVTRPEMIADIFQGHVQCLHGCIVVRATSFDVHIGRDLPTRDLDVSLPKVGAPCVSELGIQADDVVIAGIVLEINRKNVPVVREDYVARLRLLFKKIHCRANRSQVIFAPRRTPDLLPCGRETHDH